MANEAIPFDRSISAKPGELQTVSPLVRRLIANNGGPFTFTGTCTYIVGQKECSVIDPGPRDSAHLESILDAVKGKSIRQVLVTHSHLDHCAGAMALREATGAPIIGCRPGAQTPEQMGKPVLDAGRDRSYRPDRLAGEGDVIEGGDHRFEVVETPGHAPDHLAFALPEENTLFSGDHVMAWSTTVVVPPEGSMRAYMESLRKLAARQDTLYRPGHGGPVHNPQSFVNALLVHRQWRAAAILRCVSAGDTTVATIAKHIYRDLAPSLRAAAAQSVLAHLIDLIETGQVVTDGTPDLRARYEPA